jgi:hypothetical protein
MHSGSSSTFRGSVKGHDVYRHADQINREGRQEEAKPHTNPNLQLQ